VDHSQFDDLVAMVRIDPGSLDVEDGKGNLAERGFGRADGGHYIIPCLRIVISSQKPISPATRKPTRPITGILFQVGGIPERTTREEPTIKAARTMA
jgi:hypothetical protein